MLTASPAWTALRDHATEQRHVHLNDLFQHDPNRAARFCASACGISLDYSKNLINDSTLVLLEQLLQQQSVAQKREAMFAGEPINLTEQRAVLHTALRSAMPSLLVDGNNVMAAIHKVLNKVAEFVEAVRQGRHLGYSGKRITDVVNIGIGGSDLGPKMAVAALAHLRDKNSPQVHFVSNIDDAQFRQVTDSLNAETTLFIIASKTFTTRETLLNAVSAREWLLQNSAGNGDIAKHFVAVSTALDKAQDFGIDAANVFGFWDWVGGRYSLWSALGLSIALSVGMQNFRALLAGANKMDEHFVTAPSAQNLPVILALVGIWNNNFLDLHQQALLTYDHRLRLFANYVQQLDMESNGKSVDIDGNAVDYATGPLIWGGSGSDGQHAFYQLLHQGTHRIPADFIVAKDSGSGAHQTPLAANYIGQMQALMGGTVQGDESIDKARFAHHSFFGNRPSNAIVLDKLDAQTLGALIALYEHKVFVQGAIWQINSFDQFGVELGKQLAKNIERFLTDEAVHESVDSSTRSLINNFKKN